MLIIRDLGVQDYQAIWQQMRDFTDARTTQTMDELWMLEHSPVFTQGLAGKAEHVLNARDIPVVQTDRGGQVTYHGPGQLVIYFLIDLNRKQLHARQLVSHIENAVIEYLATKQVKAYSQCKAPGIYIEESKIASIGLRVRKNASYHGLALNIDMDLMPFTYINPCGFANLHMTQLKDHAKDCNLTQTKKEITPFILKKFAYNHCDLTMKLWNPADDTNV